MLDRYDALLAMAKKPMTSAKHDLLKYAYVAENYKNLKAEIVKVLAMDPVNNAEFLAEAFASPVVEIRKSVINNTAVNEQTQGIFEKALTDSSYQIIETALNKIWENPLFVGRRAEMLEKIKNVDGYLNGLKVKYLEYSIDLNSDQSQSSINSLIELCSERYEFRTRTNAMAALQRLNVCDETLVANLFNGILSFNTRLSGPSKDVLSYFKQQTKNARIIRSVLNSGKFTDKEKQKIKQTLDL
jgi:hypothetical protein